METSDQPTEENYEFHPAAEISQIPTDQGLNVRVAGHLIGLFHSEGEYYAISDFCPHQGAQLSGGYVEEGIVMCPWHAWKFRLSDGAWADSPKSPLRCQTYPVTVVGETIHVGIPKADKE